MWKCGNAKVQKMDAANARTIERTNATRRDGEYSRSVVAISHSCIAAFLHFNRPR